MNRPMSVYLDAILVPVHLEPVCLRNTSRLLDMFRQYEGFIDRVRVIANRVGAPGCDIAPKRAEEILKCPVSWQLADAPKLFAPARLRGVPIESEAAGCRHHRAFVDMARTLLPGRAEDERRGSRLGRIAASFF